MDFLSAAPSFVAGSWTPVLVPSFGVITTHGIQVGLFTKIGNFVFIKGEVSIVDIGTGVGSVLISGLPFVSSSVVNSVSSIYAGRGSSLNLPDGGFTVTGIIDAAESEILLRVWDSAAGTTQMLTTEISDGGSLTFAGFYSVD